MKLRPLLLVAAALALAPGAGAAAAQTAADKAKADEATAMEAWMKLNAPGKAHQVLAGMAGSWDMEVKAWMAPGAPPTVSPGQAENQMIMGGRFVRETVTSEMSGMPFEGMSLTGYDNVKKKYVGIWIDSMTTGIFRCEGDYDSTAKTLTMRGRTFDAMAGKEVAVRTVARVETADRHVFEWYAPGPDGKEMKSMEITYTRQE
jgi:hypothetical protein